MKKKLVDWIPLLVAIFLIATIAFYIFSLTVEFIEKITEIQSDNKPKIIECREIGGIPYKAGIGATKICIDKNFKILMEME